MICPKDSASHKKQQILIDFGPVQVQRFVLEKKPGAFAIGHFE